MKKVTQLFNLLVIASIVLLSSCGKVNRKGSIERDCTGTYLRLNGGDYLICNPEMTNSYSEGSEVKAKFDMTTDCTDDQNPFGCELYHKNRGTILITEIE